MADDSMLADVFDELFSQDYDSLKDVNKIYEDYKAKEKHLSKSIGQSEEKASEKLTDVINTCEEIFVNIESIRGEISSVIDQYEKHTTETHQMKKCLADQVKDYERLKSEFSYQLWVSKIESISSQIHAHIKNDNIESGVEAHVKLYEVCAVLQSTSCKNLKKYSYDVCEQYYEQLKGSLESKLDEILSSLKYPFSTGISAPCFNKKDDTEEHFKNLLTIAVKLQSLSMDSKYSLVSILLTNMLKKRFHFHFYGNRHTNNIEKPEWFFTQVLNWIRDHTPFIEGYVEPLLQHYTKDQGFEIKSEFLEILVSLCKEKLNAVLEEVLEKDVNLAHLIDETMLFDRELANLTVHATKSNCIQVLLQERYLEKWLTLEKHFALDRLEELLNHDDAWVPKFATLNITEEKTLPFFVPKCIEEFIAVLFSMIERYENIREKGIQEKFLGILYSIVGSFIVELQHKSLVERIQPESRCFCSMMNGVYYVIHVLNEWCSDVHFVTLFMPSSGDDNEDHVIFLEATTSLDRFLNELVECLVEYMKDGVQTKLKQYKEESWHALPSVKNYIVLTLSPGACNMMLFIKEHLHMLEERLYGEVFEMLWKRFAVITDKLIFDEIVYDSHFNEGGAAQLQFDVKKNLYVLFGQYTTRVESYFKFLKESCILLNLLPGSAILIKEDLQQINVLLPTSTKKKTKKEEGITTMLSEHGVKNLTIEQVTRVINSRLDWPKVT